MDFNEYQSLARTTAIYPENLKIIYPALGLCGESGEVAEKVKKLFRDDDGKLTPIKALEIMKELGDVMWYVSNTASDLGLSLEEIAKMNLDKLFTRKKEGVLKGSGDNR